MAVATEYGGSGLDGDTLVQVAGQPQAAPDEFARLVVILRRKRPPSPPKTSRTSVTGLASLSIRLPSSGAGDEACEGCLSFG